MIFLFEFKMSCKAAEITSNINNSLGLGTADECTVQWWLRETRALKMRKRSDGPSGVDNDQLRGSLKLILLRLQEKLQKNSTLTPVQSFSI